VEDNLGKSEFSRWCGGSFVEDINLVKVGIGTAGEKSVQLEIRCQNLKSPSR
jgi:hypothetical protein